MSTITKKLPISLLIALVGFPQISETIYTPALPDVSESLRTSAFLVEATLAIYFLGFALGVFIWGAISDRIGRKPTMLIGIGIYGIATIVCGQASAIETLLTWRFFQAFGASVGSIIAQTILRDAYEGSERAKLFSIMSGALAFSPAIGPLLGGFITQYFGWRANFISLSILAGILLIWTYFSLKETRPKTKALLSFSHLKILAFSMLGSKQLWGHILLISGTNGIIFGFYQEAPFVFIEQLNISPSAYGCFGLLIAGATIVASRVSYRKSHDWSSDQLIKLGSFCTLCGGIFFTLLAISGVLSSLIYAILALFLIFFGIGLIIPNSLSTALKSYQMAAGTAGSIFGGCYYCLIATFTWLMGILHNGTALPLPCYITFLSVVILLGSYLTHARPAKEAIRREGLDFP
jgi:Bcr/CflA subfamily drug resistance transporter